MTVRQDLFNHVINNMRYGALQDELSEAINECVNRSRETNKQSVLTLVVKIKPNGNTGQYTLADQIKTSLPCLDKGETIMFGTPEGNLQRDDPMQKSLDLKTADDPQPTEFKDAEAVQ